MGLASDVITLIIALNDLILPETNNNAHRWKGFVIMNIVAISSLSPQDHFVLSAVDRGWPLKAVLQPVWGQAPESNREKTSAQSPRRTIGRRVQSRFYDWLDERINRRVATELGALSLPGPLEAKTTRIERKDINSNETADIIRAFNPDLLIASSCPLLKRNIFAVSRLATLNLHWGVAPHYRGEHTLFWPQYLGDYENIGVTIHQIDEGIDTGPILAIGCPAISPDDTQATLNAKCARVAADLLAEVLARIQKSWSIGGLTSQERGRLFLRRDRSFRHDILHLFRRWTGRRFIPRIEASRQILIGLAAEPL